MENNSVPSNTQSPAITTIDIQIGPELLVQLLRPASIVSLGGSPSLPIDGDTPLRICLPVGELLRYLLANQGIPPSGNSGASDTEAPQASDTEAPRASVEARDASSEALDPCIPGPSTHEPPNDTPIAEGSIDILPTPNIKFRRVGVRGNRIHVAEDKALAQIKSEIAMASHNSSTAASSSRLTEPGQMPTQNEGPPATLETPATQELSPENLVQGQGLPEYIPEETLSAITSGNIDTFEGIVDNAFDLSYTLSSPGISSPSSQSLPNSTEGSTQNTQNSEARRDALESSTDFLESNLSSVPMFWQKFVRSVIDFPSRVQPIVDGVPWYKISIAIAIVLFCVTKRWVTKAQFMTIMTILQTGSSLFEYLRDVGFPEVWNRQMSSTQLRRLATRQRQMQLA
ncbi:hypothetical protein AOL_s00188g191 [Orbilia oligospora ATCC 24927]|uniref:Uncharacterized protein n=1 Tax=Arthrobotrys oligospora (strain ATCC 24927 / CBS 115.81 / DSM 1491) TaxID=756982 RepID=G1XQH9_ARTOA|nr:hypothetical protein AOL_s00188g191 [Orbilia oligospora ATCC 24927]EGX44523.1 hypothetical protein AOL_s00188g191 [Orbilia oligospora ATCC 24927]